MRSTPFVLPCPGGLVKFLPVGLLLRVTPQPFALQCATPVLLMAPRVCCPRGDGGERHLDCFSREIVDGIDDERFPVIHHEVPAYM